MEYTVNLPKSLIKRVEKLCAGTRRTPQQYIIKILRDFLAYEEYKRAAIAAGEADIKAGRVYSKDEFFAQLEIARQERKLHRTKSVLNPH